MLVGGVSDILSSRLARIEDKGVADPKTLKTAASEFESLLVTEMLKSMRASSSEGWLGGGDDQAGSTMVEMAEQQVAQAIAAGGGFGLSRLILQGISPGARGSTGGTEGPVEFADKNSG